MDAKVASLNTFLQSWINWPQYLHTAEATLGKQHTYSLEDVFGNFQYIHTSTFDKIIALMYFKFNA
jgi:hypothetical protein